MTGLQRNPLRRLAQITEKVATDGPRGRRDILAMQALQPLSKSYDGWSAGAMRPSGLVHTLNEILWFQRLNVVELGSGVSTLFIARLFAERVPDGELLSIEHNEDWATLVDDRLRRENLTDVARVVHVPLCPTERTLESAPGAWYDEVKLRAALTGKIDLLLVDGPPAYGKASATSRYPAVPALSSEFAASFSIILDDATRSGERRVVRAWEKVLGLPFTTVKTGGSIAVARRLLRDTIVTDPTA